MAKLLTVTLKVPETIPENSPVEVVYGATYYAAAVAAGGMVQGKVGAAAAGLRPLLSSDGSPLKVYGGELGDEVPPLVSIRVKPRGAGVKGLDWEHSGHPRDTSTDDSGTWDGSRLGPVGQQLATPQQMESLSAMLATGQQLQTQTAQALADVAQQQETLAAQIEGTALPPWVVTQNEPEFVEIMALLPDAYAAPTITLTNTGIVFDTVEVTV